MQVIIPRLLGLAAVSAALAALAGCGSSGSGAAGAAAGPARPSTVASGTASAAPARTQSAPLPTPRSALAPSALLDDALSAMQAQASVHIGCTLSVPPKKGAEYEDIGTTSGRILVTEGTLAAASLLVNGIDYQITNTTSVLAANGIPEAESEKLAGEWISIRPGDSYGTGNLSYTKGIRALTLANQASDLRMTGPLKRTGAAVVDGEDVYGVSGTANIYYSLIVNGKPQSSTETVYIAASGAPLPVRVSVHASKGSGQTCDFSSWGVHLGLTAPAHSVPLTSIPAS